jgi:hypothetical protein
MPVGFCASVSWCWCLRVGPRRPTGRRPASGPRFRFTPGLSRKGGPPLTRWTPLPRPAKETRGRQGSPGVKLEGRRRGGGKRDGVEHEDEHGIEEGKGSQGGRTGKALGAARSCSASGSRGSRVVERVVVVFAMQVVRGRGMRAARLLDSRSLVACVCRTRVATAPAPRREPSAAGGTRRCDPAGAVGSRRANSAARRRRAGSGPLATRGSVRTGWGQIRRSSLLVGRGTCHRPGRRSASRPATS